MEPIYSRFGRELRRIRRAKDLTQAELADRVGLGRTSIVNIEHGDQRVHLHTLLDLAIALGVDPADLLPKAPKAVPEIEIQVEGLPTLERDWVMRVVSEPNTKPASRRKGRRGAKT